MAALRPLLPEGAGQDPERPEPVPLHKLKHRPWAPSLQRPRAVWLRLAGCNKPRGKPVVLNHGNSANQGWYFSPRGHLAIWGDITGCHDWGVLLASSGQRPGTLLSVLHRAVPTARNDLAQDVSRAGVEKPCLTLTLAMQFGFSLWKKKMTRQKQRKKSNSKKKRKRILGNE